MTQMPIAFYTTSAASDDIGCPKTWILGSDKLLDLLPAVSQMNYFV